MFSEAYFKETDNYALPKIIEFNYKYFIINTTQLYCTWY